MRYLRASAMALAALIAALPTPAAEPPAASLAGIVKESATRVPIQGARVSVSGANGGASDTTGLQGQFTFQKLEPGRHWISAYDHSRAASGGAYVLLNPAQQLTGVEIFVKSGGSISGTVLDEDRQPVSGAAVVALETTFEFGQTAYGPALTAHTDRTGVYRLAPIPSDRGFLILAKMPLALSQAGNRARILMPAFYPGAPDAQGGQVVRLGSGEDRRGVDIQMAAAPSFCISGTVRGAATLTIAEQLPLVFRSSFTPFTEAVSEGQFRVCGLHPGDYRLSAVSNEDPGIPIYGIHRRQMDALANAVITDRDVEDVQLLPSSAPAISGDTVLESSPGGKTPQMRIRIALARFWNHEHADEAGSDGRTTSGLSYGDYIQVPGAFTLGDVPVNDYMLDVNELPDGCYVKDATLGGAGVLHQPVRLTQADAGRLRIALACNGGSLRARVTDREGHAVSNVHLYLIPEEAGSAAALDDVLRQAEVEDGWSDIVTELPPGRYLVLACDLETDGTAKAILKLWRQRAKGKPVEIGPGEAAQVTLEIVGLD